MENTFISTKKLKSKDPLQWHISGTSGSNTPGRVYFRGLASSWNFLLAMVFPSEPRRTGTQVFSLGVSDGTPKYKLNLLGPLPNKKKNGKPTDVGRVDSLKKRESGFFFVRSCEALRCIAACKARAYLEHITPVFDGIKRETMNKAPPKKGFLPTNRGGVIHPLVI